ncbi:MAG TPA: mismatch-specific DNA-glycosylase [Vicinamibacteria bacterium]|nr:mismatch-specific DNA-glycosylase [Vicinamibacteria bacterium]
MLPDYLGPGLDVVLVGINPGLRSAERGHHFAGPGNKFWNLLWESGLVPSRLSYEEDHRLPEFGIGLTNIVARASRSSSDLSPSDYAKGRKLLARKLRRHRPGLVAPVGLTVLRQLWDRPAPHGIACGLRRERFAGLPLFVLPNPSGRNAHYSYEAMLQHWQGLAAWLKRA